MIAGRELILASASPRRRELLQQLGLQFRVVPSLLAEPALKPDGLSPCAWAEALAHFKAASVMTQHPQALILGADTLVVCAGEILGKPADRHDAARMLNLQAGQASEVITGICLICAAEPAPVLEHEVTRVWMRNDPHAIADYLASDDWRDKAGAYGLQTVGDRLIERVAGSFSNVVGLPLERLRKILRRLGYLARLTE